MMNDVKALCDARAVPNLVSFCGAYHVPDGGQVRGQATMIVSPLLQCFLMGGRCGGRPP